MTEKQTSQNAQNWAPDYPFNLQHLAFSSHLRATTCFGLLRPTIWSHPEGSVHSLFTSRQPHGQQEEGKSSLSHKSQESSLVELWVHVYPTEQALKHTSPYLVAVRAHSEWDRSSLGSSFSILCEPQVWDWKVLQRWLSSQLSVRITWDLLKTFADCSPSPRPELLT